MQRKPLPITAGFALVGGSLRINNCGEKSLTSCSCETLYAILKDDRAKNLTIKKND